MKAPAQVPNADLHVHSEWSWDAPRGDMEASCRRALALGLKVVAFSEHADYSEVCGEARLDVEGYLETVRRCRRRFPQLAIWTAVELGEPHRHRLEAEDVLARGRFDLVLGSVHSVLAGNTALEISELGAQPPVDPDALMVGYCDELIRLIEGPVQFEILTHLEYPRRFWPAAWGTYRSARYREPLREVLAAAARRGLVLELNTTRGGNIERALCPGPEVVAWWRQAGGKLLSFASDAHDPGKLGAGFERAAELAASAGFQPSLARVGLWMG